MEDVAADMIEFWQAAGRDRWFTKDAAFDEEIRARFLPAYEMAAAGQLLAWVESPEGALALIILLDQFPRNLFRGSPQAFATDAAAMKVSHDAIAKGFDKTCDPALRQFFYMPLMHSENLADQARCVELFAANDTTDNLRYAIEHRAIIARFGRFPHRNAVLGRESTAEEVLFLSEGGFSG